MNHSHTTDGYRRWTWGGVVWGQIFEVSYRDERNLA